MENYHGHRHQHHVHKPKQGKNQMEEEAMHGHHGEQHVSGPGGHSGHHEHMIEDFRRRFWISLIVTIPVLVLSEMIQDWFGFKITFTGDRFVLAVLSTFIYFYGGWPFLQGLWDEVKNGATGMMTLIGVAITAAWAYSFAITLGLEGMDFYWEMASLIVIMLLGHWMEMKSVTGASRALDLLVKMMPASAHLVEDGKTKEVPVEELKKGDIIVVKPGEKIPADGIIAEGESYLDESMLTGESKPVKKSEGDKAIGGSVNGNSSLRIKIEHTGKDSYLNKVIRMVEDAQKVKSKTQHLADRAAKILTFVALGGGFLTLIVWLLLGFEFVFALERMVTVMVISCPHALGLAVPLVVAISTTMSASRGLLIRNRTAFENARNITTIVFDKTGTLTKGSHELSKIVPLREGAEEKELLKLAAGLEQHSEHFIAKGILVKAAQMDVSYPSAANFKAIPGVGIEGLVEGRNIKITGPGYLKENNIQVPDSVSGEGAATVVFVLEDEKPVGYLVFEDEIREESFSAVKTLKNNGMKNLLLTGDNERVAEYVSNKLGMDGFFANVLPDQKLEKVKELQDRGELVAMTGDGINDAPALAQANVGIAVGSGTDVAAETADIVLVNSNPQDIASLILFGKATHKKMVQNLIWATGYNVLAIPLAAGVLYSQGIVLNPAIGAVLMSLSTIIVAINAQFLKKEMG